MRIRLLLIAVVIAQFEDDQRVRPSADIRNPAEAGSADIANLTNLQANRATIGHSSLNELWVPGKQSVATVFMSTTPLKSWAIEALKSTNALLSSFEFAGNLRSRPLLVFLLTGGEMARFRIVAVSAALVLVWGASSQVIAGSWMSGEQINAIMSGNTTYGKHATKDKHGHSFRRADGTFVGWNNEDGQRTGTWRVQGNKFCRTPDGDSSRCFELYDNGDGTYKMYIQPNNLAFPKKHVWTWTKVVPGNSENLK